MKSFSPLQLHTEDMQTKADTRVAARARRFCCHFLSFRAQPIETRTEGFEGLKEIAAVLEICTSRAKPGFSGALVCFLTRSLVRLSCVLVPPEWLCWKMTKTLSKMTISLIKMGLEAALSRHLQRGLCKVCSLLSDSQAAAQTQSH